MTQLEIANIYSKIALDYKILRSNMQLTTELKDFYISTTINTENPIILDAGCGPGRDIKTLLQHGSNVFGIDISNKFLEIAKIENPDASISYGNILNLKFKNNFFDGIWSCAVLSHIKKEEVLQVLNEFYIVLKDNASLSIVVRKGYGTEIVEDSFKGIKRLFSNFEVDEFKDYLLLSGFSIITYSIYNEKDRFGKEHRDIDYIYFAAKKLTKQRRVTSNPSAFK